MIDRATVEKILDAADIVDVVSDFVSLRRRGANFVGLCPFHNDRNPSFYVSRSKGLCKCFSCGEGGSAVNFIMKHEQLSYPDALRYLARKYHIEIEERELTDDERAAQTERESMLILNEFACQFFEDQLHNTRDGQEIGLSYFNERGFSEATIKKFRLGYSPESRTAFYDAAIKKGYNRKLLFDVGLCIDDNHGGGYDRFRGRVMFPVFNVSGKIVAFGGRTLKKDLAKYVNSPESITYNKRNELYGLFQAKREISKRDKCFIVEGYADVISMHQAGFENVIASSGTALTEGHIHQIHRFTENITELFDGDAAGIHAAMRGVDMLLAEGMNVKILLLPPDEDPDSYARSHSASEVQAYIDENETDFITFKTRVLLEGAENDPIKRANAITDVVKSIAVIPQAIVQQVYIKECSIKFGIAENVLAAEVAKHVAKLKEQRFKERERERIRRDAAEAQSQQQGSAAATAQPAQQAAEDSADNEPLAQLGKASNRHDALLYPCEKEVARYVAKYGMWLLCDTTYEDGTKRPTTVVEYIQNELLADAMEFSNKILKALFDSAVQLVPDFYEAFEKFQADLEIELKKKHKEGIKQIQEQDLDSNQISVQENELQNQINAERVKRIENFRLYYLEKRLCSHLDDDVRHMSINLVNERNQLSKIHTQYTTITPLQQQLEKQIPEALYNWKNALVSCQISDIRQQLATEKNPEEINRLLRRNQELKMLDKKLSKLTGERVIVPKY